MKTLALFSSKGGVGRTSLVYHLGFMLAEQGHRVVLADLDPQADLSARCLTEARLEAISSLTPRPSVYGALTPLLHGAGDVEPLAPEVVTGSIAVVPGDLQLAELEEEMSQQWSKCLDRDEHAFRVTTSLHRIVADAGAQFGADIALLDVGPNWGAINRAALIAADHVLVPASPSFSSMQGLEHVGSGLATWRTQWSARRNRAPDLGFELPQGEMRPLGYVVTQPSMLAGGGVEAARQWLERMPAVYRQSFGEPEVGDLNIDADERCVGQLKDYRSLMLMAQESRKPMFLLKPADGAIGGHQGAVRQAYSDFGRLASNVVRAIGGL